MPRSEELVSAIIPTYNHSAKCTAAVESVLSQRYINVELSVVDDGAKDNIQKVIPKISRKVLLIERGNAGWLNSEMTDYLKGRLYCFWGWR